MKPMHKGLLLGLIQCLLALSLAGKYAWDREHLPRVWVQAEPVDPQLPVRGRYVSLRLRVDVPPAAAKPGYHGVQTRIRGGRLTGDPVWQGATSFAAPAVSGGAWTLNPPVAYFIADGVADPSRGATGAQLWVEVSVPEQGPPRPAAVAGDETWRVGAD